MKLIHNAPETQKLLRAWGAGKDIVKTSFFFWNSGTHLQMSQEGLLRTLLHQILTGYRHIVSRVFQQRFEKYLFVYESAKVVPLQWSELTKAFRNTIEELCNTVKIVLFIDGLDKFDEKHSNLIDFIRSLLTPNVKVCFSSRPWIIFEDAFKHEPNLLLQNLTFSDIHQFVSSKFHSNPGFNALKTLDPRYAMNLVTNVTTKSSGVFLWVHLVVESLLEGLSGGERTSDLQSRLESLPPDLEDLFWKILGDLEPTAFQYGVQLFDLIRSAVTPITFLHLSFADEDVPNHAFDLPIRMISREEKAARVEIMRRRLDTCTRGLLEATSPKNPTVRLKSPASPF